MQFLKESSSCIMETLQIWEIKLSLLPNNLSNDWRKKKDLLEDLRLQHQESPGRVASEVTAIR